MKEKIQIALELGKVRITFFVAFSTSAGYLLYSSSFSLEMLWICLGVFLLASGSSAINHIQEKETDRLMKRTKNRPLAAEKISVRSALFFSMILLLSGSVLTFFSGGLTALILGLTAFVWYNLIYTPLKKRNALAVIPGSVIGAIPPVIGWSAAGGYILNAEILALALFFFIWQIPHFWLLLLLYGKEYQEAGFPTLTSIFNNRQLSRITFIWIAALAFSCLLIPFAGGREELNLIALAIPGIWLIVSSAKALFSIFDRENIRKAFLAINLYVLSVVIILSVDKLI